MQIDRSALVERLRAFALEDHGLVTGAPGVGKTVVASQLASRLLDEGRGAVFVGTTDLADATAESIQAVLPHAGNLMDTLGAYFAQHRMPGVMIIDGFDAARDPVVRLRVLGLIRDLIFGALGRWHVIVTVRVYDAQKSPDLLGLFPPKAGRGPAARQIEVPRLEPQELEAVLDQVPGLSDLYRRGTRGLRDLLRLPFHLWLIEQVLSAPASPARTEAVGLFSQVETEVQLLDRFWQARITRAPNGGALATLAGRAAEVMVAEQSLAVPAPRIWTQDIRREWDELLSSEILTLSGPGQSRVGYGHNILFDYAASLYVLSDHPSVLEKFLLAEPSRALFLRPSLVYLFAHLWQENRSAFWQLFRALAAIEALPIRLVARLIPPYVLASEARSPDELAPLQEGRWHDADQILLWVLQGARFSPDLRLDLWAEFVSALTVDPSPSYAWEAAVLINALLARAAIGGPGENGGENAHAEVRSHAGVAARRLLARALAERGPAGEGRGEWWDALGSYQALPLVLDTMDSDPAASADVIRPILGLVAEVGVPIRYFTALAHGIEAIIRIDPELATSVYLSIFSHEETSDAPTNMGGAVLRLQSTRRQDFHIAQYGLAKAYPHFLSIAPREAIRAGLESGSRDVIMNQVLRYLDTDEGEKDLERRTRTVQFRGHEVQWIEDHSSIWGSNFRDDGAQLIEAAASHIAQLAKTGGGNLLPLLDDYATHAKVAFAWARLLYAGAEAPRNLAEPMRELVLQRSIQTSLDLREPLGEFLQAAAPHWNNSDRGEVENSILSLGEDDGVALNDEYRERLRDQLLAALPEESLQTPEAQRRLEEMHAAGDVPRIEPLVTFEVHSRPYSQEEWLRDQGVDPERVENRTLREQVEPLDAFRDAWRNDTPSPVSIQHIEPDLWRVVQAVEQAKNVDALVRREAWTSIAGTAATIARSPSVAESDERWTAVVDLLLRACAEPTNAVDEGADRTFTWPAWSPGPQTEAVQGFGALLWERADPTIVAKMNEILLTARDPALRYLAIRPMLGLFRHDPDRYWRVVEEVAASEANPVVITELLEQMGRLAWRSPRFVRRIVEVLWTRWSETEHKNLFEALAPVLIVLAAHANDLWAEAVLEQARREPLSYQHLINRVHFEAAAALTPRANLAADSDYSRRLAEMLVAGIVALGRTDASLRERQNKGEPLATERGRVHQMVDTIASRLYLNLRVQSAGDTGEDFENTADAHVLRSAELAYYYGLVWPIIDSILAFGESSQLLPAPTAHHLLELFNVLLKVDPAMVLQGANRAVQSARSDNYNLDSLAIREVVRLVETVLADHRDILLGGAPMYAMLQLLETFAEVGWTEALHLIWRLDEIFR